jgi:predicted nuclease of predicted toxin-antitoxin system
MKILLDTCVWYGVRDALIATGYDAVWSGDWSKDPGDVEIMAIAYRENRVLVTLDKDFGELAIVRKQPHCGIVRLVNLSTRQQVAVCLHILNRYSEELQSGSILTANLNRVRIRLPEEEF